MRRVRQIERFSDECHEIQLQQLTQLLDEAKNTEYGRKHGFARLQDINDFKKAVPLVRYEDLRPYIMQMVEGKSDVLWRGVTRNFAQSSGTSDGKSKYVPITKESFSRCHYRVYTVCISNSFLTANDHVLFIDDFLAYGNAAMGMIDLARQAGATIEGMGFIIEKGFQGGGDKLREAGYNVHSLAIIDSLDNCEISFR